VGRIGGKVGVSVIIHVVVYAGAFEVRAAEFDVFCAVVFEAENQVGVDFLSQ